MRQSLFILFIICLSQSLFAQLSKELAGIVVNASDREALPGASITFYNSGKVSGLVANKEGKFFISPGVIYDSVKFSMVGFHSRVFYSAELNSGNMIEVKLDIAPGELPAVVLKPLTASEIIQQAIAKIPFYLPKDNFESKGFYREIIGDKENYFSIAEAIFSIQYFPSKENYKLKLERGRSKEDVSYTRLFEDFHPGGGPQSVAGNSFVTGRPDFLNAKKINRFNYHLDSLVQFDGRWLYCIHFDQKPGIKEALEKGTVYIDTDDYAIVRYEAENSPLGTPYIKDLTGTDKIFAEILHINFQRKGWKRRVDFSKVNDKWLMSYAEAEHRIGYQQTKKGIDLDMTISIELLMTDLQKDITKEISKDEEWKRKNIVANLPTAFDPDYWGSENIISPTEQVQNIVAALSKQNGDALTTDTVSDWEYMNRNFFVSWKHTDTITLVPVMKCLWEDDETGGLLYKEWQGDFLMEARIRLVKNSDTAAMPDKGFQQAGLMIRSNMNPGENYVLLSVGTGGNPNPKVFFKKTLNSRSKTVLDKKETMNGWLRLEKKGRKITALYRSGREDDWEKIGECETDWLNGKLQLGLSAFASFSGQGPKMQPDMRVEFSQLKIDKM